MPAALIIAALWLFCVCLDQLAALPPLSCYSITDDASHMLPTYWHSVCHFDETRLLTALAAYVLQPHSGPDHLQITEPADSSL